MLLQVKIQMNLQVGIQKKLNKVQKENKISKIIFFLENGSLANRNNRNNCNRNKKCLTV